MKSSGISKGNRDRPTIGKETLSHPASVNPAVKIHIVSVNPPEMNQTTGDLERLVSALNQQVDIGVVTADLDILQSLQRTLRKGNWIVTCAVHIGVKGKSARLIHLWPGEYHGPVYGLAVDLGTTSIAAQLYDLRQGDGLKSVNSLNPQIQFGADVMTRVSYSMMNNGGAATMTQLVRETINAVISELIDGDEVEQALILDTVVVCNPTMHHLLLGIDPVELGVAPFTSATSNSINIKAKDLELNVNPSSEIYFLPFVGSHVGADGAAVLLSEEPEQSNELCLIVDIGTNAEIFLGNSQKILSTSSPTGPALEGAQIKNGQRAAIGAIERVRIDVESKEPRFKIIGSDIWSNQPGFEKVAKDVGVTGICGSGVIELVAEMRIAGILDATGLIGSTQQTGSDRCVENGRTFSYRLWEGDTLIEVSNNDIREVQMAKAALFASIQVLMDEYKVKTIDRIVLAGAFGNHLSAIHAMMLGMIPDCRLENITFAGNSAGTGASIALLDSTKRIQIEALVKKVINIETATDPRLQLHFSNASNIPNAQIQFPILNSLVSLPELSFHSLNRQARRKRKIH